MKSCRITCSLLIAFCIAVTGCSGGSDDPAGDPGGTDVGADGIVGHPPADMLGEWKYRSVTVDGVAMDLATHMGWQTGAVEANVQILTNSAYVYEEVNFRGGQLWAEWGFVHVDDGEIDVNRQFNTNGAADKMTVYQFTLQNGVLTLRDNTGGVQTEFVLTM